MKCDAYRILIAERENGELDDEEAGLLRHHLEVCESCCAYQQGRRASDRNAAAGSSFSGDVTYRHEPVAQPAGRSWGWAAVAVIGLAALVALALLLGPGRSSHRGETHRRAPAVRHPIWPAP